ncbi:hypothetical protein VNI00_008888 [Paramarasmius palmivorus]|uniref:Ribosomal protein L14 n=1 Tax=Paramarasmius palmivorus TaxID=297713 RepID=A0AAW0CPA0_9AGAR
MFYTYRIIKDYRRYLPDRHIEPGQELIDEPANGVVSCMVIRSVRCYRGVIVASCNNPSSRWSIVVVLDLIVRSKGTRGKKREYLCGQRCYAFSPI